MDVSQFTYAHRGLWTDDRVPENSAAAFHSARNHGLGVELDVRLTADGVPMVFHDATLARMCGDERTLEQVTAEELAREVLLPNGYRIPSLADVLDIMGEQPVLIELKVDRFGDTTVADVVADTIKGRAGALAAMSFDPICVARLRKLIPDRPVGLLIIGRDHTTDEGLHLAAAHAREIGCDYLAPHWSSLEAVAGAAAGLPLVTWTIREQPQLETARRFGAAPIFEGFSPDLAKQR